MTEQEIAELRRLAGLAGSGWRRLEPPYPPDELGSDTVVAAVREQLWATIPMLCNAVPKLLDELDRVKADLTNTESLSMEQSHIEALTSESVACLEKRIEKLRFVISKKAMVTDDDGDGALYEYMLKWGRDALADDDEAAKQKGE